MDGAKLTQMKQFLARLDELEGRILNLRTKTAQIWSEFERALRRQQDTEPATDIAPGEMAIEPTREPATTAAR